MVYHYHQGFIILKMIKIIGIPQLSNKKIIKANLDNNITLKLRDPIDTEARISELDDLEIKLMISDNLGNASSDEISIFLNKISSNEFLYGEDEYNLENFVNPEYLDMYMVKDDWLGLEDQNGVIAETNRFASIFTWFRDVFLIVFLLFSKNLIKIISSLKSNFVKNNTKHWPWR